MNQVNRRRWSLPLGGVESCLEKTRFYVPPEWTEYIRSTARTDRVGKGVPNFQILGAAARKEREPISKISARNLQQISRDRLPENTEKTAGTMTQTEVQASKVDWYIGKLTTSLLTIILRNGCTSHHTLNKKTPRSWCRVAFRQIQVSFNYSTTITQSHTHTRLTALFRDYPGEPVQER